MATATIKQAKTISLDITDWEALESIAKAHKKSVNKYLEMLIKGAIAEEQELPIVQSQEEFERDLDRALAEIAQGEYAFRGTFEELKERYDAIRYSAL